MRTSRPDLVRGRLLGELAARATVAAEQESIDGWWLKVADLPFRRCNAVLPPVGAGLDAAAAERALDAVERWYAERGAAGGGAGQLGRPRGRGARRPVGRTWLRDRGAGARPHLLARARSRERVEAGPTRAVDPGLRVEVREGIDEGWARHYGAAHGGDDAARERTEAYGRMLQVLAGDALGVAASVDGEPAGVGFGVLDQGWLGIFGMGTAPTFRGRGVATAVVGALLGRAAERGATGAYLQVETDNPAAISLYEGMGFRRDHGYHYRVSAIPGVLPSGC
jgi:ribosomal protein S18 acetylase RimI-like enzyme